MVNVKEIEESIKLTSHLTGRHFYGGTLLVLDCYTEDNCPTVTLHSYNTRIAPALQLYYLTHRAYDDSLGTFI
jgi:hypothetical protein